MLSIKLRVKLVLTLVCLPNVYVGLIGFSWPSTFFFFILSQRSCWEIALCRLLTSFKVFNLKCRNLWSVKWIYVPNLRLKFLRPRQPCLSTGRISSRPSPHAWRLNAYHFVLLPSSGHYALYSWAGETVPWYRGSSCGVEQLVDVPKCPSGVGQDVDFQITSMHLSVCEMVCCTIRIIHLHAEI